MRAQLGIEDDILRGLGMCLQQAKCAACTQGHCLLTCEAITIAALVRRHFKKGRTRWKRRFYRIRVFEERLAHFLVQRRFHDMLLDLTRVIGLMSRGAMCHRCHSPICASAIRMARMAEMVPLKNPIVHDSEQSCQESRPAVSFSDGRCLNGKHER